jgi:DNA-binding CsgD family transcriptional regulator
MAVLERHLLRFADELHAGGWRDAKPSAVHASRFAALDELPPRQREIVDRLLRGQRIASIAASMYISASTARNHLSRVFATFGVHSQSELLALLRSGPSAVEDADAEDRP